MIAQDRLVKTFLDLVKIDSPSGNEQEIVKEVSKRLHALGFNVETDSYGNVIGKLDGEGEPFLLNAHLDTVEPGRGIKPVVNGDKITSDGETILGGDCKAGVSVILEGLESLLEDRKSHVPIEVIFTLGEELGLKGAANLDYSKISARKGVTFDGEEEVGNIAVSSPNHLIYELNITGRAAHAGSEPEKGISAIRIASEIISKLKLGRIDQETTANVGVITGGSVRNAVPESTRVLGEIRSRSKKKLLKQEQAFREICDKVMSKHPKAKLEIELEKTYEGFNHPKNHPVIKKLTDIFNKLKIQPKLLKIGGGTDTNVFLTHGIEAIVVGMGDYDAHTKREYVLISNIVEAAKVAEALVTI